ncbi:hypothetical protein PanWU01x14_100050 [Parasponia andersonii]|uniref:RNase H type-1 domain-containing protein n=1 Tax=Parasponia andersonii TaxID=3476 RepID=A0A2P5D3G6_PARAD|nr:hypothetical protein PanWU01x14_100050 [Parasponia andersonii]
MSSARWWRLKFNSDVRINEDHAVIAVVGRNENGTVMVAYSERIKFVEPMVVEAMGLLAGVQVAIAQNCDYVILEGDCAIPTLACSTRRRI